MMDALVLLIGWFPSLHLGFTPLQDKGTEYAFPVAKSA